MTVLLFTHTRLLDDRSFYTLQRWCRIIFGVYLVIFWVTLYNDVTLRHLPTAVVALGLLLPLIAGGVAATTRPNSAGSEVRVMIFVAHVLWSAGIAAFCGKPWYVAAVVAIVPLWAALWSARQTNV